MAFDPIKPVAGTPVNAVEMRGQLNGLKTLIDGLQAQIAALQQQLAGKAFLPDMGEFDPGLHDPPTIGDLQAVQECINQMIDGLQNAG